ncbi:MBL fold metallo-hydrolase RNA specificity domain-containing protein [Vulgatibacter sp.]|uniref:MBL fold metallo-hydrolase RNA specificity domain-containing protein n=1 Tax=Vulgatibacter sp. TaxID=1971226 RepID=UPI00356188F3
MASIQFLGAAGTVTGSRHLLEHEGKRILLDCGLFQGEKAWRRRNWDPFPVPPSSIDVVVLSHAHIDHSGYLPRLVKEGFTGTIFSTPATRDLLAIMLPDSGRLHEEEARFANKMRYSRHDPALPLYTEEDANRCIPQVHTVRYGMQREIVPGVVLTFHRAGHILGSASAQLDLYGAAGYRHTLVYSGDLGRYGMPIITDPAAIERATTLLVECTYGDRDHLESDPRGELGAVVRDVVERKGVLIIPSFAIGRCQDILYHLRQLQLAGEIPASIPVFVDSPMAIDATPLYLMHREEHDEEMVRLITEGMKPIHPTWVDFTRGVRESQAINDRKGPMIVISASGMASGGRVLHHLKHRLPDPKTTVLFVGYQAQGTRGRKLVEGAQSIRIHGIDVPVRAQIKSIAGFSAHADRSEVHRWLSSIELPPQRTFCVHGEPSALEAMRQRLEANGWAAEVPGYLERFELG